MIDTPCESLQRADSSPSLSTQNKSGKSANRTQCIRTLRNRDTQRNGAVCIRLLWLRRCLAADLDDVRWCRRPPLHGLDAQPEIRGGRASPLWQQSHQAGTGSDEVLETLRRLESDVAQIKATPHHDPRGSNSPASDVVARSTIRPLPTPSRRSERSGPSRGANQRGPDPGAVCR